MSSSNHFVPRRMKGLPIEAVEDLLTTEAVGGTVIEAAEDSVEGVEGCP